MSQDEMPLPPGVRREWVLGEAARIAAAAEFARAPVMRRLLDFLVHATLDGRGDQLKAYSVAVDGLGRSPDFDSQSDSYPRVQVGRLRRMLDAFYAREGADGGYRLTIPPGRYRVEFEPLASVAPGPPGVSDEPHAPTRRGGIVQERLQRHWRAIALGAAALTAVVALGAGLGTLGGSVDKRPAPRLSVAPVVSLDHIQATPDSTEVDTDAILLDGLRRSWLVKVRTDERPRAAPPPSPAYYELSSEVSNGVRPFLRLRLMRAATGEIIWTGQAAIPADHAALRDALTPSIAELIQPYGVIATDQRATIGGSVRPGYECILTFDQYRRERTPALFQKARDCVAQTLALEPADALALAARAYLTIDAPLFGFGAPPSRGANSLALATARRAVAADPYSSVTQLALSRALRFTGNCTAAVRSGRRAVALNPYDPDLHALVGGQLMNCGDPGAEALLKRAIALDSNPPFYFYPPLVFLALDRGDVAAARAAAGNMTPAPNVSRGFYSLVIAVVEAAGGDKARARAAWARLEQVSPTAARNPDATLRHWVVPDSIRMRCMGYLRRAGLVPAPPQATVKS